jgi:hypothetical protein
MPKNSPFSSSRDRGLSRLRRFLRGRTARQDPAPRRLPKEDIDTLAKRVILPFLPVSDEEMARATHQDRGQKFARQEMWAELSATIRYADSTRLATPGGETASLLLASGARSDVVLAAEDALHDGAAPQTDGLSALEEVLEEMPDDYATALIVALAHVDTGWAWRNIVGRDDPERAAARCAAHIARADAILAPHARRDSDAPSLLAARCALHAACTRRARRLPEQYEALLRLDPDGHRHMRALGRHILPSYAGGLRQLEVEARKATLLTHRQWGAGGYAWVYFDALALNKRALDLLDPAFFIEGLQDIVARKHDQHIVNLLTAFCAITMAPGGHDEVLTPQAEAARAALHDCLDWLLQDHLQELHPLIWSQMLLAPGHAPLLPSRRALVAKGRQTALRIIAARFAGQIADGSSIAFSQQGMYRLPTL